ncbi:MAG: hypothetical protein LBI06_01325, partial [Treponema sp.]|nr:hypothetical protein [Treponema sp.]
MKKFISPVCELRPLLWLVFHGGLFLALGISLFVVGPLRINSSLFDIIPVSSTLKSAAAADAVFGERGGRQIIILSANEDFSLARDGAEALYNTLLEGGNDFESLNLWADETFTDQFINYLHDHRFML